MGGFGGVSVAVGSVGRGAKMTLQIVQSFSYIGDDGIKISFSFRLKRWSWLPFHQRVRGSNPVSCEYVIVPFKTF